MARGVLGPSGQHLANIVTLQPKYASEVFRVSEAAMGGAGPHSAVREVTRQRPNTFRDFVLHQSTFVGLIGSEVSLSNMATAE